MRIPAAINENIYHLYTPSVETLYLQHEVNRHVHIENFKWDASFFPTLVELCLRVLINIFEKHQYLDQIIPADADYLYEFLPTHLPLELTIPLIQAEIFWKRSYINRWGELDELRFEKLVWKTRYVERHIVDFFENIEPEYYDHNDYIHFWPLVTPFVKKLFLRQLIQEKFRPSEEITERELIHHIDFSKIFRYLTCLTELNMIFGPREIGEKFNFSLFTFSMQDCKNLAAGINFLPNIRIFRLHRSLLYDEQLKVIIQAFSQNKTLVEIDISYCKINNNGAYYFAYLIEKHPTLEILKLTDNLIEANGIYAIAKVLQTVDICPLRRLDLRMNPLGGEGLRYLFSFLIRNNEKPNELIIPSIGFTEEDAVVLGDIILPINKSLHVLDISNNLCGIEGGEAIARGLQAHSQLLYIDYRGCGFSSESKFAIRRKLYRNDCLKRRRVYNENDVTEEDEIEIKSIEEEVEVGEEAEEVEEENQPTDDDD